MANLIDSIDNLVGTTIDHTDGENVFLVPGLFDSLVQEHGVQLEHFIALPCPQSDKNINNIRSNHSDHLCEDGMFYTCAGTFAGIITNAPKSNRFQSVGLIDSATMWLIVPRFYEQNGEKIYFSPYDKVYVNDGQFKEVLVPEIEQMEASTTGIDRLRFPVCKVTHIVDKYGSPSYQQGVDFIITKEGDLQWISQNRPQFNATLGEGGVYSIRYLYRPFWYVATVEHEIRLTKMLDPDTGDKSVVRLPQYLRCVRERYFRDAGNTDKTENVREEHVPSSGANLPWR